MDEDIYFISTEFLLITVLKNNLQKACIILTHLVIVQSLTGSILTLTTRNFTHFSPLILIEVLFIKNRRFFKYFLFIEKILQKVQFNF